MNPQNNCDIISRDNFDKIFQFSEYNFPLDYGIKSKGKYFSVNNSDDYNEAAGKKKLCKAAGLTGAEKKACKKKIVSDCGHKGLFPSRVKKEKWLACANAIAISTEQSAKEAADELMSPSGEREIGLSTGAKFMIGATIIGAIALIGFTIVGKKSQQQMVALKSVK
jgi:hypothetical protein